MKNYYQIIGVDKDASQETIKNAYLLKVKKYHPDLYAGDKDFALAKTSELNEAYEILKDENKRAEYDAKINKPKKQWSIKKWWQQLKQNWEIYKESHRVDDTPKKKKEKPKLSKEEQQLKNDKNKLTAFINATIVAIIVILLLLLI